MAFASQSQSSLTHSHDDAEDDHAHPHKARPDATVGDVPGHVDIMFSLHHRPIDSADAAVRDEVCGSLSNGGGATVEIGRGAPSEISTATTATVSLLGKRSANDADIRGEVITATNPQSAAGAKAAALVCSIPGCGRTRPRNQLGEATPNANDDAAVCFAHKRDLTAARAAKQCQIGGCQRVRSIGPYCTRHGKDPTAPIRNAPEGAPCKIPGCTRVVKRHGLCYRHYNLKDTDPATLQAMERSVARPMQQYVDDPRRWDTVFQQLQTFVESNGHFKIPLGRADLFELGQFVDSMRLAYVVLSNGDGRSCYESAFEVSTKTFVENSIEGVIAHACTQADTTTAMSVTAPAAPLLQVSTVLTPDRIAKLNSIRFPWQSNKRHIGNVHIIQASTPGRPWDKQDAGVCAAVSVTSWEARYQELLLFYQRHGHYKVSRHSDFALWSWCKSQRQKYKQTMEAIRTGNYDRLGQGRNHGGCDIQFLQTSSAGEKLRGKSCTHESHSTSSSVWKMSAERIVRLQAINFEWEVLASENDTSWNQRYVDLLKYKAVHGNCRVSKTHENKELAQWVKQMRRYYALKMEAGNGAPATFTDDRIRQLEEIGFEWRLK